MALFATPHMAPFDAPAAPPIHFDDSQFKRPLGPSTKRKHAAIRETNQESETRLRSASHTRAKTESCLFGDARAFEEPVSPMGKQMVKKARLSITSAKVPALSVPLPYSDVPAPHSIGGTRQETAQLTEQFERLRLQEEDKVEQTSPVLSRSGMLPGAQSGFKKTLVEQEAEDRINQVRQIKSVIANPICPNGESFKVRLPTLSKTSQPDLNCISPETVAALLEGKYNEHYDAILIIDCRFDYEYVGGHIRNAINLPDSAGLEECIFDQQKYQSMGSRLCLVFHCEFSSHRGPRGYKKFRSLDRKQNAERYPHLDFPEMYLLEGGYRKFWETESLRDLCEPRGYIEMKAPDYLEQCKEAMKPRGRSVSKVDAPIRRHFSMSCSNIFSPFDSEINSIKTKSKSKLSFDIVDKEDQENEVKPFEGASRNIFSWTSR